MSNQMSSPVPEVSALAQGGLASPWKWAIVACALLGTSGAVRAWQEQRFAPGMVKVEPNGLALKDLPTRLGDWSVREGTESTLDPRIARLAGSADHIVRTYVEQSTGVSATVLVLYGRAREVVGHTPELCYPSAGYVKSAGPDAVDLRVGDSVARFRSLVFTKEGGAGEREEVHYSFRHDDRWSPDAAHQWKRFRQVPTMYKIQVARRLTPTEHRELDRPAERLLAQLVAEFERWHATAGSKASD